jgi:UDPglucose--hexose-1-phosphate uridylyltransferase
VAGGLFELRRDEITGWWVAVVVDREFDRQRFALPATPVDVPDEACQNCLLAPADGVWVRSLKPQAFTIAGSEREARERGRENGERARGEREERADREREWDRDEREPTLGLFGDVGSWSTIAAPRAFHRALAAAPGSLVIEMLAAARDEIRAAQARSGTEYFQVVQNWGAQAGARTNHLCIDLYDLPHIPHRIGEEMGGAARYVIREGGCPWCRLVRDEVASRERLVFEDAGGVCFAPWASRSPFELWVVPRHHDADFGRTTDAMITNAAETLQKVLRLLSALDGPAYNLVLHTAPLHERVDEVFHWHWEIHPRLREIAGLELGTGLPVNPVSPEEAVEELLAAHRQAAGMPSERGEDAGGAFGQPGRQRRTWDDIPRR